jgi:hypothetical protein
LQSRRRYLGTMLLNRATDELVITRPKFPDGQEVELYFQSSPSTVGLYDRYVFPVSRLLDLAASPFIGKNVRLTARKPS